MTTQLHFWSQYHALNVIIRPQIRLSAVTNSITVQKTARSARFPESFYLSRDLLVHGQESAKLTLRWTSQRNFGFASRNYLPYAFSSIPVLPNGPSRGSVEAIKHQSRFITTA